MLILGAGGHAQVVADILLQARDAGQPVFPIGYLDDDAALHGKLRLDLPILGYTSALGQIPHDAVVIAIGNNKVRKRLADELYTASETFAIARHPAAIIAPDVSIGSGAMICAGVVVNTGSVIGAHVILNTGCTVDHHNSIGSCSSRRTGHTYGGGSCHRGKARWSVSAHQSLPAYRLAPGQPSARARS